jgi:hypothetical protein
MLLTNSKTGRCARKTADHSSKPNFTISRSAILRVIGAAAAGVFFSQIADIKNARAAGRLSSDADMLGITTTMTADQVKQFITEKYGTTKFPTKGETIILGGYHALAYYGFEADIASKADKAAAQKEADEARRGAAGCNSPLCMPVVSGGGQDKLTVYTEPSTDSHGSSILALTREVRYPQDTEILLSAFLQTLTEKFGPPANSSNNQYWFWTDGDLRQCGDFANEVAGLQLHFSSVVNSLNNKFYKPQKCSMYLSLAIGSHGSPPDAYVDNFRMSIVNVGNSYRALSAFAANALAESRKTQTIPSNAARPNL